MNDHSYIKTQHELAKNIRTIRDGLCLKQYEIADFLNIDNSTYSCYETGKTLPDIFTLIKLSEFFCTKIETLLLKDGGNLFLSSNKPHVN